MFEAIHRESVIASVDNSPLIFNQKSIEINDLLEKLTVHAKELKEWYGERITCRVMAPGYGWVKGKVRFTLEFEKDE